MCFQNDFHEFVELKECQKFIAKHWFFYSCFNVNEFLTCLCFKGLLESHIWCYSLFICVHILMGVTLLVSKVLGVYLLAHNKKLSLYKDIMTFLDN